MTLKKVGKLTLIVLGVMIIPGAMIVGTVVLTKKYLERRRKHVPTQDLK